VPALCQPADQGLALARSGERRMAEGQKASPTPVDYEDNLRTAYEAACSRHRQVGSILTPFRSAGLSIAGRETLVVRLVNVAVARDHI
jgi:hypothetical protein